MPKPWGPWAEIAFLVLCLALTTAKVIQMRKSRSAIATK